MKEKLPGLIGTPQASEVLQPEDDSAAKPASESDKQVYAAIAADYHKDRAGDQGSVMPEPIGFISPKQVELIGDPDCEFGKYIPMRKTPAGNFTLALYTNPAKQAEPKPRSAERDARIADLERELAEARERQSTLRKALRKSLMETDALKSAGITGAAMTNKLPEPVITELEALIDKLEEELGCAEAVLDSFSADLDMQQTSFDCIGDYITAVFEAERDRIRQHILKEHAVELRYGNPKADDGMPVTEMIDAAIEGSYRLGYGW